MKLGAITFLSFCALVFLIPTEASAALSRSAHINQLITEDASVPLSVTTSSFTPPNNSLVVAVVGIVNMTDRVGVTVSGGGLTWTKRVDTGWDCLNASFALCNSEFGAFDPRGIGQIWTAPVTTGASMAITVEAVGDSATDPARIIVQAISYTGYQTANPTGVATTSQDMGDAAKTITFTSAPAATSEVVAARYRVDFDVVSSTATEGTGWEEIYDLATSNGYGDMQLMVRSNSTSANITWDNLSDNASANSWVASGVGLEIQAAPNGRIIRLKGGVRFLGGVRFR